MRQPDLNRARARGFLLIVAILVVVVVAVAIAALGNMTSADIRASSGHAQSDQAYFTAVSGLEVATREFANGTGCGSLTFPGGAIPSTQVGAGTFTTSGTLYPIAFTATLQAGIANNSLVSQIPLSFTVGSIANLAPHGEILIDSEFITYGGSSSSAATCLPVTAPCLTGTQRATNGSTIASHTAGTAITQQSQCVIRSIGTVQPANRVVESALVLKSGGVSNLQDVGSRPIPTAGTPYSLTGGAWAPGLPAGDNYLIAIVTFSDVSGGSTIINTGNLKIVATNPAANPLDQSTSNIYFGNGATPSATVFPQETQVLLAQHASATANATYDLQITPATSSAGASARAQILVISGIQAAKKSFTPSGANQDITTVQNLALSANTLPAGDNIIIGQVQLDVQQNGAAGDGVITAGNLAIRRGTGTAGPILMSNTYGINLPRNGSINEGTGFLFLAFDTGAAAGTQYSVTGLASGKKFMASASLLVFNGFSAAFTPPASKPIGTTASSLGLVADTYSAGERVVLAGIQYASPSGATTQNIPLGKETIVLNGSPVSGPASSSAYNWALCPGTVGCADFFSGLLWRGSAVAATPTFEVKSQADNLNMTGAANILTIRLGGSGVRQINSMEIYP